MPKVRTRYAPSPTGDLHIGGARTALFSYLYAKHYNGDFVVRIEDTDALRNTRDGEKLQLMNLKWLEIFPDEAPGRENKKYGPYRQSAKTKRYSKLINKLVAQGRAYKAYDNGLELEKQRREQRDRGRFSFRYDRSWLQISDQEKQKREAQNQFVIRLQLKPNQIYKWTDIVRGKIAINTNDIGDFVIQRENGAATYNLAVVVDDYDMAITHVLRGEEHISNTPKQLAIYDALQWKPPRFGHLTIITNMDGKKLSKRDFGTTQLITSYKTQGYNNKALFNFLALLGWSHPQRKEILSPQEIIAAFDPRRLSKSPTKFDAKKLDWFGRAYMKMTPNSAIKEHLNFENKTSQWVELFITTYKQSAVSIDSLKVALKIYDDKKVTKTKPDLVTTIFSRELKKQAFTPAGIALALVKTSDITNKKGRALYMPIRKATTYQEHGPELAKAVYLVGEELVKTRLERDY